MPDAAAPGSVPALLLAAGLGSRLAPLTGAVPKCLVPIGGQPLLGHWFDLLGKAGFAPLIVNTHHHAEAVRDFVAASRWRDKVLLRHEGNLLGTGGTLLANRGLLSDGGPFFVAHADNLSRFDVAAFLAAHLTRPAGCLLTMMLFRTPTPESCGIVELDARNVVIAFHEKSRTPPDDLANGAVYMMEPEAFRILEEGGRTAPDISLDLVPRCLGRIFTWRNDVYHRDIGTPESYAAAEREYGLF